MQKLRWLGFLLVLLASALACIMPFAESNTRQTETASSVLVSAAQTIAAQQMIDTATAIHGGLERTATANSQFINATQTALSLQATLQSEAQSESLRATAAHLNATATAQVLAATVAANDAQATAFAQALTATALAYQPPPPTLPSMIRLSFATGATSTYVDGQIFRGQTLDYVLRALSGQTMLASVYSANNNVYLGISGLSDGVPLMRTSVAGTTFTGVLPGTQDYRITLFSPNQTTNYTLQIIVPARIQFARGAISAALDGYLSGGEVNYYLARANAGQQMSVTIFSPGNDIFLTIYGMQDGSPLVRSMMEMTSWTGILPATQDYMIQAVSTGASANYTLQVIIQ